ncbi:MAG: efflux RND transporter periplasmic adaptor subunit [Alphaproteobacteria bacterium]
MSEAEKARKPRRGWIKWVAGIAVVAVLAFMAFAPEPLPVDTGEVTRGALEVTVTAEGRTRIRDIFTISAPVNGRVLRVTLDPGDPVNAGETVVAIFEPVEPDFLDERTLAQARARLEQAKAATIRSKAELDYAESEWDRVKNLPLGSVVTQRQRDQRKSAYDGARAAYNAARADQAAAQAALIVPTAAAEGQHSGEGCCLRMAAPVNGEVLRVLQESERVLPAGSAILEVGNPSDLEIVVDLLSQDAVRVRSGQAVRIDNWGGDDALNGVVRRVEPSGFTKISALGVEEQRVNVIVDITDPHEKWAGLRDAYRVEPHIVVWSQEDQLVVPLSALFRQGDDWAVFRVVDDRAVLTPVKVGERNAESGAVLGGLSAGDQVIRHPGEAVSDGVRVAVN